MFILKFLEKLKIEHLNFKNSLKWSFSNRMGDTQDTIYWRSNFFLCSSPFQLYVKIATVYEKYDFLGGPMSGRLWWQNSGFKWLAGWEGKFRVLGIQEMTNRKAKS